jgi:hypothetical protein
MVIGLAFGVPAMTSVSAMAEHMNQGTRGQQQKRQIGQAQDEVSPVLGQQVERGNHEQKPESDAHLPRTFGARAIRMSGQGSIGVHDGISVVHGKCPGR